MTDEKEVIEEHYVWRDVGGTDSNTRVMVMTLPKEKPVPETTPEQQEKYEQLVKDVGNLITKNWGALLDKYGGYIGEIAWDSLWEDIGDVVHGWETDNEK